MQKTIEYSDLPEKCRCHSPLPASSPILGTWFLIFSVFVLCASIRGRPLWPIAWALGAALIGVLQYHINILAHHGVHYYLSENRAFNDFLTRWILLGPQGLTLGPVRKNHLYHHKRLGQLDDEDRLYYGMEKHPTRRHFLAWTLSAFAGGMFIQVLRKILKFRSRFNREAAHPPAFMPLARQDLMSVIVSQCLIIAAARLVTGEFWPYFALWVAPLITVAVGLNTLRSCLEHADAGRSPKPEHDYSFVSNRLERFLLSPFQMNYHAEHHRFTGVPFYRLPELRKYLQGLGDYGGVRLVASYRAKWKMIWSGLDA